MHLHPEDPTESTGGRFAPAPGKNQKISRVRVAPLPMDRKSWDPGVLAAANRERQNVYSSKRVIAGIFRASNAEARVIER